MSDAPGSRAAAEEAAHYRRLERAWQDDVGKGLLDKPWEAAGSAAVFERQFGRVAERLELERPGLVVEIGCGKGHLLQWLSQRAPAGGARMLGIDISKAVLALPERGVSGIQADGEFLPFGDASVRTIVYDGALHHLIDYPEALRDAYRVIEPGGSLVLFEPVSSPFSRLVHHILDPIIFRKVVYESPIDIQYKDDFREERVRATLDELGMSHSYERSDFLAYPLTGCYAGSAFGRSAPLMNFLLKLEEFMRRVPLLRNLAAAVSWRFLIVARKPR